MGPPATGGVSVRAAPSVLARAATVGLATTASSSTPLLALHRNPRVRKGPCPSRRRAPSALGAGPYPINPRCAINQHSYGARCTLTRARGPAQSAGARDPARVGGGHPRGGGENATGGRLTVHCPPRHFPLWLACRNGPGRRVRGFRSRGLGVTLGVGEGCGAGRVCPRGGGRAWSSAGLSLPSLDVPADPVVGAPTGRVFIVEPIEDPVPASPSWTRAEVP